MVSLEAHRSRCGRRGDFLLAAVMCPDDQTRRGGLAVLEGRRGVESILDSTVHLDGDVFH